MAISKKIEKFMETSSWIRKMFEEGNALKKKVGAENVFDFSLGNPIMEPPQSFLQSLREAVEDEAPGQHRYMPNAGFQETREHVAKIISRESGLNISSEHIVMTCGAAAGLNVILKTLLDPRDEVIIFSPYFAEYVFYIDNNDGIANIVETSDDFNIDLSSLEKAINNRTKAVLINSPNNPTGVVYSESVIKNLSSLLNTKSGEYCNNIYLISDEPYKKIVFDDTAVPSIFRYYSNSVLVNSHSKDLAIPGERIGHICVSPECEEIGKIIRGAVFCNRTLGFVNAPALMQRVIKNLSNVSVNAQYYQDKRDIFYTNLTKMGYDIVKPLGAFYLFPKSPLTDEVEFVKILQTKNILTVPGSGFGRAGHFRISYCVPGNVIEKSLKGFEEAIHSVSKYSGTEANAKKLKR